MKKDIKLRGSKFFLGKGATRLTDSIVRIRLWPQKSCKEPKKSKRGRL